MDICQNFKQKIEELLGLTAEIEGISFELEKMKDSKMIIPIVKEYIDTRNKWRALSEELMTFWETMEQKIREDLRETGGDKELIAKVIEKYSQFIATNEHEISQSTLAYLGPLFKNIFKKLPERVKLIYTDYPEGRVHLGTLTLGDKSLAELKTELQKRQGMASDGVIRAIDDLIKPISKTRRKVGLVFASIKTFGLKDGGKRTDVYKKAESYGLEKCSPEVALQFCLQMPSNIIGSLLFAMDPLNDRTDKPPIFLFTSVGPHKYLETHRISSSAIQDSSSYFAFIRPL